jgi:hypothetical protein
MNAFASGASDVLVKRTAAEEFFKRLESYLNENLPSTDAVNEEIVHAKSEYQQAGKASAQAYEGPFFKKHIVPTVHKFLIADGLSRDAAIQALLAEGHLDLKEFVSGTPASRQIYPYKKTLATTLKTARKDWWGTGKVLSNSCPDLAVRLPGGPSIVFEGKLFRSGGPDAAKSAIVAGLYECFFYRALPTLVNWKEPNASGYDYACFLAYDASPLSSLRRTWKDINREVERSFWEALNIYVMIVPHDESAAHPPDDKVDDALTSAIP